MDNEILDLLKSMQSSINEIQKGQMKTNERLGNIENEIKEFKTQFTDFEGKSSNNHVEVVNKIDNLQKGITSMEMVSSKKWNDIERLKAITAYIR